MVFVFIFRCLFVCATQSNLHVSACSEAVNNIDRNLSDTPLSAQSQSEDHSAALLPPAISQKTRSALSETHNINPDVLSSGVLCLPGEELLPRLSLFEYRFGLIQMSSFILIVGTRDKSGHALVTVTMRNTIWLNPNCNSGELVRIMVYFFTTLR